MPLSAIFEQSSEIATLSDIVVIQGMFGRLVRLQCYRTHILFPALVVAKFREIGKWAGVSGGVSL